MESFDHELEHPKKRRRREISRRPLAARLAFDDSVKGNAALVPESLWAKLADGEEGMPRRPYIRPCVQGRMLTGFCRCPPAHHDHLHSPHSLLSITHRSPGIHLDHSPRPAP